MELNKEWTLAINAQFRLCGRKFYIFFSKLRNGKMSPSCTECSSALQIKTLMYRNKSNFNMWCPSLVHLVHSASMWNPKTYKDTHYFAKRFPCSHPQLNLGPTTHSTKNTPRNKQFRSQQLTTNMEHKCFFEESIKELWRYNCNNMKIHMV